MSNVSDEDFSETSSISGSESSIESSESFYSTAEDVERYDDSLEPIATEEEIASYAEQLAIEEEEEEMLWSRFSGEVDVGTWSVLLFSLLLLTIASIYLNLLTLQVGSREAIAGCSVALLPSVSLSTVVKLIRGPLECCNLSGANALTVHWSLLSSLMSADAVRKLIAVRKKWRK